MAQHSILGVHHGRNPNFGNQGRLLEGLKASCVDNPEKINA